METKLKALRIVLIVIGIIFVLGLYPLMILWPSGWRWSPYQAEYEQMIVGIYATLGVFLLIAARHPMQHLSLIWFTAWSSLVHAGIMTFQAIIGLNELGHLFGDVPALYIVAILLFILIPKNHRHP